MNPRVLRIDGDDNVAVALEAVKKDSLVKAGGLSVPALEDIPAGHKIALAPIAAGQNVLKYGAPIGHAAEDIPAGAWVHTHNVRTNLSGPLAYAWEPAVMKPAPPRPDTFWGYMRADGRAGTRNEVWVIPTVGCVNQTCRLLARRAQRDFAGRGVDGIFAMTHPYGCSQLGDDLENTCRVLADFIAHPNAGAVLVVGLGCEGVHIERVKQTLGAYDPRRVVFYNTQDVEDELEAGMAYLDQLVDFAAAAHREELSMEHLVLGLKCGGSDAFSGLTANPLIGRMADRVVDAGGAALLTEVPEMFGAETRLMARARDEAVYGDIVALINDFKEYFMAHGQPVYENPSPGNKEGGITTLEDKSLGCTFKGGSRPVAGVLRYGQRTEAPGLQLVESPGNDMVAITALMAAGAQLILFSTGRGNPLGAYVPTVKIGTNTPMSARKAHWIDYDAGVLITGETMDQAEEDLWQLVRAVASGQPAANETWDYRDMTFFKTGVTV